MKYLIRKRKIDDCKDIAHIITISWRETYRGVINDNFLDNMPNTEEARVQRAIQNFDEKNNHQYVLEVDNKVVGFVKVCKATENIPDCGEIQALYIINGYKGNGYGRKLVNIGIKELKEMGYKSMIIGCLEGNPTNNFYTHLGGKIIKKRVFSIPEQDVQENVYFYENI